MWALADGIGQPIYQMQVTRIIHYVKLRSRVFEQRFSRSSGIGMANDFKLKSLIMAQIERWRQA